MYRRFADIVSLFFHPLFIVSYILLFLIQVNPYMFGFFDDKSKGLVIISVVMLSLFFPLLSIFMMKALGLITDLKMHDKRDRIGPLIATGLFYLWLYVNIRKNDLLPEAFSFFVLGTVISLFSGLFLNSFTKISLHSIGAGGLITALFLFRYHFTYGYFELNIPFFQKLYLVHVDLVIIVSIVIAGLIGTCRLYLKAHSQDEIYVGYLVGFLSQMIAYRIFFF